MFNVGKFSFKQFFKHRKSYLGSFKLEGRQFQAAGPAWKKPRGPIVLVEVAGTNSHRTPQISGVIDQGAKRPVCSIETDTGVRSRVDTYKRRYRVWTRPFLGRGASVVHRAWRPKRWPTWVGQGQGELRHGAPSERLRLAKVVKPTYRLHTGARVNAALLTYLLDFCWSCIIIIITLVWSEIN